MMVSVDVSDDGVKWTIVGTSFSKPFITFFFSDLISGHQLSLEQVAGCHKEICQNSDKCINVMKVSHYAIKFRVLVLHYLCW